MQKIKQKLSIIWLTALILNIIWELSHYHLYIDLSNISKYPHLILASITDATIITIVYKFLKSKTNIVLTTLTIAILIEAINLNLGRWQYTDSMPTILNLGLSPLVQLPITALLTGIIVKKLKNTSKNQKQ